MEKISFVIPCYNSEKYLKNTVEELVEAMKCDELLNYDYDITLINDGSKDNTFGAINAIAKENPKITGIDFTRNFGQHNAIMAGLNNCQGDIIVCLDDDGQTPPHEIIKLINALDENTDVVYAKYEEKKHSKFRNLGSKINDIMAQKLLNKPKSSYISSFFAMKKHIKDNIIQYKNPYPYMEGLVLRSTTRIKNVLVEHRERKEGKSQYTLKKLLSLWINGFTNFSVTPLRVALLFSFIFMLLAIVIVITLIYNKLNNPDVPLGWTSVIIAILVISSVITFLLGLIGEYVGRIYISINNNPQYVMRKVVKYEEKD